jgi:hypothetical protein
MADLPVDTISIHAAENLNLSDQATSLVTSRWGLFFQGGAGLSADVFELDGSSGGRLSRQELKARTN